EGKAERHIRLLAPLAFVSPRIVSTLLDGTAPADLTITKLARALPYCWAEQERRVGPSAPVHRLLLGASAALSAALRQRRRSILLGCHELTSRPCSFDVRHRCHDGRWIGRILRLDQFPMSGGSPGGRQGSHPAGGAVTSCGTRSSAYDSPEIGG